MKKRLRFLSLVLVFTLFMGALPLTTVIPTASSSETDTSAISKESDYMQNNKIIGESDIPLRLYYDEEAAHGIDTAFETKEVAGVLGDNSAIKNADDDWENWSIPIGNGYFGANVFGRTETERIQITEKTLANPYGSWNTSKGGLNNFSETYIDFGHTVSGVTGYSRELDFETAVSTVNYTYGGVNYSREYFTSYPDKAIVIKLTSDTDGALGFTLRPTVPYEQSYAQNAGDGVTKTGCVTSSVESGIGTIELTGKLGYYDVDFMGLYKVYTDGNMTASTTEHTWSDRDGTEYTDTDGTIVVDGAKSAYIVITLGTDYVLTSETFTASDKEKPTFDTNLDDTRVKVEGEMDALCSKIDASSADTLESSYQTIKAAHVLDHSELFGRVTLDLNCNSDDFDKTTDVLVSEYRTGANISTYLEVLLFQYGRYLLIASSREGALPSNLQGVWNRYNFTPWSGGFWHNVNIQMNYWPAFSTNLAEMFQPYVDFNEAYMPQLKSQANNLINTNNPSVSGADGGNGWTIGVGGMPFSILGQRSPGHLGFTTQMFYDYYAFTKDDSILEDMFTIFAEAARYITKTVIEDEDGNLLVEECESPEQYVNGSLYFTNGTTYAQSFIYESNYNLLRLAEEMGVNLDDVDSSDLSADDKAILKTVLAQIDRYDPIVIGYSGQVKEFREETYYGDLGAAQYVHISQLVGLYPATIINNSTPAWQDAARVSLAGRGPNTEGWGYAHRINAYARLGEGEMAHTMLHNQIRDSIGNNLWSHYFVYQIDGNCGATAGVSEMLLQSHEGYIAPLAAIPELWASGSYTGLVARGNFVVGAEWENGLAKTFNITSQSGGVATVSYPGIANVIVKTAAGDSVAYNIISKDRISFDTEIGETYIIYGFSAQEKIDAPEELALTASKLGSFKLACTEVDGAIGYRFYKAAESAATYTLVGASEDGRFNYEASEGEENVRTTFAVTAVSASGTESKRTLAYYLPTESTVGIEDTVGNLLESGKLQVTVKSTGGIEKYKLYTMPKTGGDMTLICESEYPIITVDEYLQNNYYYVFVVNSETGEESEGTLINKFGASSSDSYDASNIFVGKSFVAGDLATATHTGTHNNVSVPYNYGKLTDGSTHYQTGRFSTVASATTQTLDGIIDLGNGYILNELQIYDFNASATTANFMGTALYIEVYSLGEWTTVGSLESNSEILSHRVGSTYLSFDLGGIRAEKIRLYIPSRYLTNTISISEIKCSGVLDPTDYSYSDNLLLGKELVPTTEAQNEIHIDAGGVDYGYTVLTDGSFAAKGGRFSTRNSSSSQMVDATVDLGGVATIKTLTLCAFAAANTGADLTVEVYLNGKWSTVVSLGSYEEIQGYASELPAGAAGVAYSFDLGGVNAEKIRIYISKNYTTTISYYEIMCSGYFASTSEELAQSEDILSSTVPLTPETGCSAMVHNSSMAYDKLTEGVYDNSGRYSSSKGTTVYFDAMATLNNRYKLNELRLYDFAANTASFNTAPSYAGKDLLVQVLSDGVWVTVIECDQSEYAAHRVGGVGSTLGSAYLSFDLGGIIGEKVRIYNSGMYGSYTISYFEIELIGALCIGEGASNVDNIFAGFDGVVSDKTADSNYPLSNLFDGNASTYTVVESTDGAYAVTMDFGEIKTCRELKVYEHIADENLIDGIVSTASDATKIEIYRDGMWLTIYDGVSLDTGVYTAFDMYAVACEKVRITFSNTRVFDGESELRAAEIAEISCTTSSKPVDKTALIEAYIALDNAEVSDSFGLAEMKEAKLCELKELLMDVTAGQTVVDEYTSVVNNAKEKLTTLTPEVDLVTGEYGDFSSYNLKLEGDIGFNFYADLDDGILDKYPDAFVVIEYVEYYQKTATIVKETRRLADIPMDDSGRYVVTLTLPAVQMTDSVKLRLVFDGTNMGSYVEESIRSYADKIIANENGEYSDADINLVKAMLNYGGLTQAYFNYNTDDLANDGIDVGYIESTANVGVFTTTGDKPDGFTPRSWSLALESSVKIRLYAEISNTDDYFITVSNSTGTETLMLTPMSVGDNVYRIEIDLTDAKYIDDVYTVSILEMSSGKTAVMNVSATKYLDKMTSGDTDDDNLIALCEAMKLYCSVANGYT